MKREIDTVLNDVTKDIHFFVQIPLSFVPSHVIFCNVLNICMRQYIDSIYLCICEYMSVYVYMRNRERRGMKNLFGVKRPTITSTPLYKS